MDNEEDKSSTTVDSIDGAGILGKSIAYGNWEVLPREED